MRNLNPVLAGAAMLASFALLAGPAAATPSTSETIVLKRDAATENEIGWNAYGPTFFDSGSWTTDFRASGGGPSPVFAGTVKTTETGTAGTFVLDFQVLANRSGFGGTCQLTSGTGAYIHLRGSGAWTFSTDGVTNYFTCTLRVHQDP